MISAIRHIGRWSLKKQKKSALDALLHSLDPDRYGHILVVDIDPESGTFSVYLRENDSGLNRRLLYREGPGGNSANYSPVAKVTEWQKTWKTKILRWFDWVKRSRSILNEEDVQYVLRVYQVIQENLKAIEQRIEEKIVGLKGVILAVIVDGKDLYDLPTFVRIFNTLVNAKDMEIFSDNQICSICGERKERVMAGSSAFKFYTIDKPGFISGEFDASRSWRNFPVCEECNLYLQEGKQVVETKFCYSFAGMPYYLIPQTMFDLEEVQDEVFDLIAEQQKKISLGNPPRQYIGEENEILEVISEEQDYFMLNFLFLRKVNSAERILYYIHDVLPSRLRKIFEAKKKVEEAFPKKDAPGETEVYHFGTLRPFFYKSDTGKREPDLDRYFLELIGSVFHGKPVDRRFLIRFFMKEIRTLFLNQKLEWRQYTTHAMMNLAFFTELGLLEKGVNPEVESSQFSALFQRYPFLDSPEKRAIFLLGSLTQMLLNLQYQERKAAPFANQLKSLKLREKEILALLPKVQDKFRQYKKGWTKGKQKLATEISQLFLQAPQPWKLSVGEINFFFVAGMNMMEEVRSIIESKQTDQVEEEELHESL